jgi:hypothetical protein
MTTDPGPPRGGLGLAVIGGPAGRDRGCSIRAGAVRPARVAALLAVLLGPWVAPAAPWAPGDGSAKALAGGNWGGGPVSLPAGTPAPGSRYESKTFPGVDSGPAPGAEYGYGPGYGPAGGTEDGTGYDPGYGAAGDPGASRGSAQGPGRGCDYPSQGGSGQDRAQGDPGLRARPNWTPPFDFGAGGPQGSGRRGAGGQPAFEGGDGAPQARDPVYRSLDAADPYAGRGGAEPDPQGQPRGPAGYPAAGERQGAGPWGAGYAPAPYRFRADGPGDQGWPGRSPPRFDSDGPAEAPASAFPSWRFRGDPAPGEGAWQDPRYRDPFRFRPLNDRELGRMDGGDRFRPLAPGGSSGYRPWAEAQPAPGGAYGFEPGGRPER